MKVILSILVVGTIAVLSDAYPQGFIILNDDGNNEKQESLPRPPSRPFNPLPPMHLPPQFQNQFSLPPPPSPPLHIQPANPFQHLQLGFPNERLFFDVFSFLFPWLRPTTTPSPTPEATTPTTTTTTKN